MNAYLAAKSLFPGTNGDKFCITWTIRAYSNILVYLAYTVNVYLCSNDFVAINHSYTGFTQFKS